jgi:hypothetical protein
MSLLLPEMDPCRCPLCGQPNACAMAGASAPGPCWCARVHFSADLLAQVPEAARNKACICAACVAVSKDDKPQGEDPSKVEGA